MRHLWTSSVINLAVVVILSQAVIVLYAVKDGSVAALIGASLAVVLAGLMVAIIRLEAGRR